jgi:hypothetical protein
MARKVGLPSLAGVADLLKILFGRTSAGKIAWSKAFLLILLVRVLFLITYPPNSMGGDTTCYRTLLVTGQSNLVLASGYPFIMGLPWRNALAQGFINDHPVRFAYILVFTQHLINIAAIGLMFWALRRLFDRITASIAILLYGLNPQVMGAVSSLYPEWLQASLLIVSYCFCYAAWRSNSYVRKITCYSICAITFTFCYLVKFNVLPLVVLPLGVLFLDRMPWKKRAICFLVPMICSAVTLVSFVEFYHLPSTGTRALTRDKAWILLDNTRKFSPSNTFHAEAGINTKRLLALNRVLPLRKDPGIGPFMHINAVAPEVRAPYRRKYLYLLSAKDKVLDDILRSRELPAGFDPCYAFYPVAYYIGLEECDNLGVYVYLEHIRAYFGQFLSYLNRQTWVALTSSTAYPFFPAPIRDDQVQSLKYGWALFAQSGQYWNLPFWYEYPLIWLPGVKVFSAMITLSAFPTAWIPLLILLTFPLILRIWRQREKRAGAFVFISFAVLALSFIVFSNAILIFRWKEQQLLDPIVCVLGAVSLMVVVRWLAAFEREQEHI